MFVKCSKRVKFTHPENPKVIWEMPAGFIGDVPTWVEKEWYFDACCNDGTITVVKSKSDRDIQNAVESKPEEKNPSESGDKRAENESNEAPKEANTKKNSGGKK